MLSDIIKVRRDLHRIAELSFEEHLTSNYLKERIEALGLTPQASAGTGLVVDINGENCDQQTAIMFRADMDALPILEQNDFDYKSCHEGIMHACGHDAHMSIIFHTLEWAVKNKSKLIRPLKFIFQPAEEKIGGASVMISEGVMQNPDVAEVYGLHIANRLPSGVLGVKSGISSAYCDEFKINIEGKGGHGARPYQCIEPIMIATRIIQDCQNLVARELYAMDSNVMTFTTIHSGSAYNVIDDHLQMGGTLRTLREESREFIVSRLEKKFMSLQSEYGCKIDFELIEGYPAIHNDHKCSQLVREIGANLESVIEVTDEGMGMGGEDVSYFLREAPGCYFLLGVGGDSCAFSPHHSPTFDFDESALICGYEIFTQIIARRAMINT
ncbi:MAG: M20 family metallopeptidase [bacterium]|nr:M20 family metallopeptidase [bacterium]